ncbi:MAG TPA: SDR family NAD(P)-dependent oxidoreductase [Acidimicrobiales bacterium]|nr:SDR family NAD(P)-dependent oxidoreductase [Acidimicrobiales bacterium]
MGRSRVAVGGALALVTGAGSGIGRATALELSRRGARVLIADIDDVAAKESAEQCGGGAAAYQLDVADGPAFAALADRVSREHGTVDILVNNAGVGASGPFLDTAPADWDWIIGINLMGVINGCRAFGPAMVERRTGHVVNVASGLGYTPTATESAYVTTKAGVIALSRCLRADWQATNVGVSVICPGVINTAIISRTRFLGPNASPDRVERTERLFRRGHSPDQVARAIVGAVERDRPLVPVGWESKLGWVAHRLGPLRLSDAMARAGGRWR